MMILLSFKFYPYSLRQESCAGYIALVSLPFPVASNLHLIEERTDKFEIEGIREFELQILMLNYSSVSLTYYHEER